MKQASFVIDVAPVTEEVLSAAQFLKLTKENPGMIQASRVVHPRPGKRGFGSFMVRYTHPIYKQKAAA